jgi:hypothetical protein
MRDHRTPFPFGDPEVAAFLGPMALDPPRFGIDEPEVGDTETGFTVRSYLLVVGETISTTIAGVPVDMERLRRRESYRRNGRRTTGSATPRSAALGG